MRLDLRAPCSDDFFPEIGVVAVEITQAKYIDPLWYPLQRGDRLPIDSSSAIPLEVNDCRVWLRSFGLEQERDLPSAVGRTNHIAVGHAQCAELWLIVQYLKDCPISVRHQHQRINRSRDRLLRSNHRMAEMQHRYIHSVAESIEMVDHPESSWHTYLGTVFRGGQLPMPKWLSITCGNSRLRGTDAQLQRRSGILCCQYTCLKSKNDHCGKPKI